MVNGATPTPVPLGGYVVTFEVLARPGAATSLITVDSTSSQVEVQPGGVTGRTRVTLSAAQTGGLKRDCVYSLHASLTSTPTEPVEYVASGPVDLLRVGE